MRSAVLLAGFAALICVGAVAAAPAGFPAPGMREAPHLLPAPADAPTEHGLQHLTVSGGCFWGVQGVFEHVRGVERAISGYTGGAAATAHYDAVSGGETGHAESVRITYDPAVVSSATLLRIFFSVVADPTVLNAQGPDTGTQYRTEIWFETPEQARLARAYIAQLDAGHAFETPIVTRVDPLRGFWPAEPEHQDFLARNPDNPYIAYNDLPKIAALKRLFPADYVASAVTAAANSGN